jgi:hypothetical protein
MDTDDPLTMPLDAFVETYVKPAALELSRKFIAGEPLDEIEKKIIANYFAHRAFTVIDLPPPVDSELPKSAE